MASATGKKSSNEKVRAYRERMRAQGLRQVQFWIPDVRSAQFKAEAHRQSLAIAQSEGEVDDQAFVDSVSVLRLDEAW